MKIMCPLDIHNPHGTEALEPHASLKNKTHH